MSKYLKQATLIFLLKDDQILLAMKKRGFGEGLWNGVGGKPNPNEPIDDAAVRECIEEINVKPIKFNEVATLDFYFTEAKSNWDQQVKVYLCSEWIGEPVETEEMRPAWYKITDIPYEDMWVDDKFWLPLVLDGKTLDATFHFDDNDNLLDQKITIK
jgi:ADP-ribose pyrophosphatase YjhB (NUDIX family)